MKRRTKRARLQRSDRLFWILLRHFWPHWAKSLLIVKPETVVGWHRQGFRLYWRFRSRSKTVGRPTTSGDIRILIQTMAHENFTWGAPRIHGELLKLGVHVSERTVSRDGSDTLQRFGSRLGRIICKGGRTRRILMASAALDQNLNCTNAREKSPGWPPACFTEPPGVK